MSSQTNLWAVKKDSWKRGVLVVSAATGLEAAREAHRYSSGLGTDRNGTEGRRLSASELAGPWKVAEMRADVLQPGSAVVYEYNTKPADEPELDVPLSVGEWVEVLL